MKAVQETNYLLRTLVYGGIVAVTGVVVWEGREFLHKGDEALAAKEQELAAKHQELVDLQDKMQKQAEVHQKEKQKLEQEIQRVNAAMQFLKLDHRLATIEIIDQKPDPVRPDDVLTTVRFTELGPDGKPRGAPIEGTVVGREVYLDAPTIRFKDNLVEQGDLLRGRSICRFRRMFGDQQAPRDGISLDRPPESPGEMSDFEKNLWDEFWKLANDPQKAEERGVQTAQAGGPAVSAQKGKTYHVELRASGGLPQIKAAGEK